MDTEIERRLTNGDKLRRGVPKVESKVEIAGNGSVRGSTGTRGKLIRNVGE